MHGTQPRAAISSSATGVDETETESGVSTEPGHGLSRMDQTIAV